ncbi:hypothetical protein ABEB36_008553 [Hypothenemus hampei]|uniref:Uncharacterized protein n=1 Tax=Hypothenemus hampei TaxID=57062 RepID=A0ABD1EMA1_HYPHA
MKFFLTFLYVIACVCVWVVAYPTSDDAQAEASERHKRGDDDHHDHHHHHHHHHDAVDFGAHTGEHGSFGWHAHYPVHGHHD